MSAYDEETMRSRFQQNRKEAEAARQISAPLREKRDALLAEYEPKVQELNKEILDAEKSLYDLDMEAAALARALKGKISIE